MTACSIRWERPADEELLGLHLNPEGYKAVFDELVRVIKENWPGYLPYKMPYAVKVPWEMELGDRMWDVHTY